MARDGGVGWDHRVAAAGVQARWSALFGAKDWAGLAALYTDCPAFFGSTPALQGSRGAVRAYFEALPASLSAACYDVPMVTPLGPDGFVASGNVTFAVVTPGGALAFRMTQVCVREADGWRIAAHHASARPGPLLPG